MDLAGTRFDLSYVTFGLVPSGMRGFSIFDVAGALRRRSREQLTAMLQLPTGVEIRRNSTIFRHFRFPGRLSRSVFARYVYGGVDDDRRPVYFAAAVSVPHRPRQPLPADLLSFLSTLSDYARERAINPELRSRFPLKCRQELDAADAAGAVRLPERAGSYWICWEPAASNGSAGYASRFIAFCQRHAGTGEFWWSANPEIRDAALQRVQGARPIIVHPRTLEPASASAQIVSRLEPDGSRDLALDRDADPHASAAGGHLDLGRILDFVTSPFRNGSRSRTLRSALHHQRDLLSGFVADPPRAEAHLASDETWAAATWPALYAVYLKDPKACAASLPRIRSYDVLDCLERAVVFQVALQDQSPLVPSESAVLVQFYGIVFHALIGRAGDNVRARTQGVSGKDA